jgi:hypothetical protein
MVLLNSFLKKSIQLILIFLFILFSHQGLAPAKAEDNDVYTCSNIEVELTNLSPDQARLRALKEAPKIAFRQLVRKLLIASTQESVPNVSDETLQSLVAYVGIDREKNSANHYFASFSVRFKPEAIRSMMRSANLDFNEWRGKPIAVIPILSKEGLYIWDKGVNPWRDSWKTLGTYGAVPFSLLSESSSSSTFGEMPSPSQIVSDLTMARTLSQNLSVPELLIALATLQKSASNKIALDITLNAIGPTASTLSGTRSYLIASGENIDSIMRKAIIDIIKSAEEEWKNKEMTILTNHNGSLTVEIPLENIKEWTFVRENISQLSEVTSFDIISLSKSEAQLVLHSSESLGRIKTALENRGFFIEILDNKWILRLSSAKKMVNDMSEIERRP